MHYTKLGNTGLDISRICLGCMGFGDAESKFIHKWVLKEEDARNIIKRALELGVNFFDTANIYSYGTSEEFLGRALKDFARRDEIALATKVNLAMRAGQNAGGNSRKAIMAEIDNSLRRLQTDYIDLYIIHRWDYSTPVEETMETLNDIVRAGKVRYLGASAMYAWQFQKARTIAAQRGWANFVSMQNHYNLLYREEEREMIPYCLDAGVALTPYSPLASGRLSRPWKTETRRFVEDGTAKSKYDAYEQQNQKIVARVQELATKHEVTMAQLALAWMLQKEGVGAPVVGVTRMQHLAEAVKAPDVRLSPAEMTYLEAPYAPRDIAGPTPYPVK